MQLHHIRTFVAVADTLNITRAAERLHRSQSSVTEQIQALETDLGASLFDRSRRRLSLTPAGQRLLGYATRLLQLADEARAAVAETSAAVSGKLVIGGLETLCATILPQLITAFHRRHPSVELTLQTADSGSLIRGIACGDLDIGFFFGAPPPGPEIASETVAEEDLVVIVSPKHRLAGRRQAGPDDLVDEAFLVTQPGCIYRRMFDAAFARTLPDRPRIVGAFGSFGSIRSLVEAGLGCALAPRLALGPEPHPFAAIAWSGESRTVPLTMMWRRRRARSPAMKAFLAAARECLAASDQALAAVDMHDRA